MPSSELSYKQTAALGYAASKPWGAPPTRPATWASLVRRGLIVDLRTLALTEAGKQAVAELDSLNTRPKLTPGLPSHPFEQSGPGGTCGHAFDPEFKSYCGLPADHPVHGVTAPNLTTPETNATEGGNRS